MHLKKLDDPLALFAQWFDQAKEQEPDFPDGAALCTLDEGGYPTARMVLVKAFDQHGFVFYTNLGSAKAGQLSALPKAGLCFHWKSLHKQVRIEGDVLPVSDEEADAYFASRPRVSQLGAWASRQSQPLAGRFELEARVAKMTAKFGAGTVPRPEFWSGFRLAPVRIEFWDQRPYRLHDRLEYRRGESGWDTRYLFP